MTVGLYLLKRDPNDMGYDEAEGFVIAAESPEDARTLAISQKGDEDVLAWVNCDVTLLSHETLAPRGVVLRSFVNG